MPLFRRKTPPTDPLARMVADQIEPRGVRDPRVLDAMRTVDRAQFLPEAMRPEAYEDKAVPTSLGQTISQPYIVAAMTEMLAVEPHHRVLEIGTGTGYQSAILGHLAREVITIERHAALADEARTRLAAIGINNVTVHCADGTLGWPDGAPFDRIIVTAGAIDIPKTLFEQLAEGGFLVGPIASGHVQEGDATGEILCRWTRRGTQFNREEFFNVRFVPLIPGMPPPHESSP